MARAIDKRAEERVEMEIPVRLNQGYGVSRNVSKSGIYFVTDLSFTEGETIKFSMSLDYAVLGHQMLFDCQAHVIRVEQVGDKMGVAARIEDFMCIQPH